MGLSAALHLVGGSETANTGLVPYNRPSGKHTRKGVMHAMEEQHEHFEVGPNFSAELEEITPAIARKYLGENLVNRNLMGTYVDRLAGAMSRGEWVFNGEPIQFDESGNLINGQHRLSAIVKSGVTLHMLVIRGLVKRKAQESLDSGRSRSLADRLRLRGVSNAEHIAAGIKLLWKYQNGRMKEGGGAASATPQQGLALYEEHKDIGDATTWSRRIGRTFHLSPSVGMCFWYLLHRIDWEDAEEFCEKLDSGLELEEDSPIYVYREWLQRETAKRPVDRASRIYQAALMVKAWNAYREGRKLTVLNWAPGGKRNEPFPTPR